VKICDAFGANRYPFPEDLAKQLHTTQEVGVYPMCCSLLHICAHFVLRISSLKKTAETFAGG
jgi:hypothetical protein